LGAIESDLVVGGTPLAVHAVAAGSADAFPESRTADREAGPIESASDLVFAGYDLGGIGQDSGAEPWLGGYERSANGLDGYREAFETVLEEWQGS
jgi:hypothetical protein